MDNLNAELEALRRAIEDEPDPALKRHMEKRLKLLDPELREAYLKTLVPMPLVPENPSS